MITVKAYPASSGDAFLLSFGKTRDVNFMIDMGYSSTYRDHIKSDLLQLRTEGKCLDLLVVSHIDSDHIRGALTFIQENKKSSDVISISEVWHNSYRHLQYIEKGSLPKDEVQVLHDIVNQNKSRDSENGISEVSAEEGSSFASYLYEYAYSWNKSFDNKAVMASPKAIVISNVKITIISPNQNKLDELAVFWKEQLNKFIYDFKMTDDALFDDAFELFMQHEKDKSVSLSNCSSETSKIHTTKEVRRLASSVDKKDTTVTNGSSIAFIIEYDKYKLLFLGDAHEDIIYENLSRSLEGAEKLFFDLVKISHHGSINNISNRLLSLIDSPRYLISTNGRSSAHPAHETISKIIVNPTNYKKEIFCNYTIPHLSLFDDMDLKKEFNFDITVKNEIILK